jgi:hypothetical protein
VPGTCSAPFPKTRVLDLSYSLSSFVFLASSSK